MSINPDIRLAKADCCDLSYYKTDKRSIDGAISRKLLTHAPAQLICRGRYIRFWVIYTVGN